MDKIKIKNFIKRNYKSDEEKMSLITEITDVSNFIKLLGYKEEFKNFSKLENIVIDICYEKERKK